MLFILRSNYVRHTATIYIVQLSGILIFFSILFYVIQSRSDRVTVFSFRIANMHIIAYSSILAKIKIST